MTAGGDDGAGERPATGTTLAALLREVPAALAATISGDATATVTAMTHDSRAVAPGSLFACVRGEHHDGHRYAAGAVRAGATALLVDHVVDVDPPVGQLVVADTRVAMGPVASGVYHAPSRSLRVVGVTGTNGKTTTCALLAAILRHADLPTTVIGTLSGSKTTPEAPELQARLAAARDAGDRAVVMEASSHALALHRVDGTRFAVAVFTNLGTDHLDLHGTPEAYFRAKARLFTPELAAVGVTNVDDAHGRLLLDAAEIDMVAYSLTDATDVVVAADRHELTWRGVRIVVGIGGRFNVANTLAAATSAAVLGIGPDTIAAGLAGAPAIPGRFERVLPSLGDGGGVVAIVDYAHTPDGLEEVVSATARAVTEGRVIVVFGAGGDRDHPKRPRMGEVVARLADVAVVTSDNPRSEDPGTIISAVLSGIEDRTGVIVEPDRAVAIATAVDMAAPGDVVVVAGKGHETTQTIGDRRIEFDDREVVRRALDAGARS